MGYSSNEFQAILKRIRRGEVVDGSQLLPFLTLESKSDRCQVNLQLAEAYLRRHEQQPDELALHRARACVERAWLLSRYSLEVLPLFIEINRAARDVAAISEALKRAGLERAARGDFDRALALFDRWAYAHVEFTGVDIHGYDADILACVERMTALHAFETPERPRPLQGGKIRLAYLIQGLTEANSVLVKIDQVFARLHDRSRFEVAYFSVENESAVAASPDAQAAIENFRGLGCQVFVAPKGENLYEHLLSVGRLIHDFGPDILITGGGLATFRNYFVACLKPAPLTVSFHQGPSPQFSWHTFDHSISWFRTTIPDCPADCSHVPLEFDWPEREGVRPASLADLGIPQGATVMVSGGRWPKFQNPDFWRAMIELLREHADLYWVTIGFGEDQIPFLKELLTPDARAKIRFQGWRGDYLELLAASDLFVDSYPVGGGVLLMEAMSLGLPVLSFRHDYVSLYNNNDCSGCDEILGTPELMIGRGDFGQLKSRVSKLAGDEEYRRRLGESCCEWVRRTRGEPARMVRRCEEIYERVLEGRGAAAEDSADERAAAGQGIPPRAEVNGELEERRLMLAERAHSLNRREAELNRREAMYNAMFLPRLKRGLHRRWHKLWGE